MNSAQVKNMVTKVPTIRKAVDLNTLGVSAPLPPDHALLRRPSKALTCASRSPPW